MADPIEEFLEEKEQRDICVWHSSSCPAVCINLY